MDIKQNIIKIMKIVTLMIFIVSLSGCSAIIGIINGSDLERRLSDFNSRSNQYMVSTTIDIQVSTLNQNESIVESFDMKLQREPLYTEIKLGDQTIIQSVIDDQMKEITITHTNQTDDMTLYQENIVDIEVEEPNEVISYNFIKASIKRDGDNKYYVTALFKDFLSKSDQTDLINSLSVSGLDEEAILNTEIKVSFTFVEDQLIISIGIKIDVNDVKIDMIMTMDMTPGSFDVIDITNKDKYQKIYNSSDEALPISVGDDIYYPALPDNHHEYYNVYLTPGIYGLYYDGSYSDIDVQVHQIGAQTYLDPLFSVDGVDEAYGPLNKLYEIKTAGLYQVLITSSYTEDISKFQIVEIFDQKQSQDVVDLVVTETGTYTYELNHKADLYSIYLDLPLNTVVTFADTNEDTAILLNIVGYNNEGYMHVININTLDSNIYINAHNKLVYLYNPNGDLIDQVTITVKPLEQAVSLDDLNMNDMIEVYTDTYFYSDPKLPAQYMKLEVLTAAEYRFSYQLSQGYTALGKLYDENNTLVIDSLQNGSQAESYSYLLLPGVYYYQSDNSYESVYRIKYTKSLPNIIYHEISDVSMHNQVTNVYNEARVFKGVKSSKYQRIFYNVNLNKDMYIVHSDRSVIEIYNENNKKIDFVSGDYRSSLAVTYLKAGKYKVSIKTDVNQSESYFPLSYAFVFYELSEVSFDDSVNPNYQLLNIGTKGMRTSDYLNDVDGFKIVIPERGTYWFTSTIDFTLIYNNKVYDTRLSGDTSRTLNPGIYYVLNYEGYEGTWQFMFQKSYF